MCNRKKKCGGTDKVRHIFGGISGSWETPKFQFSHWISSVFLPIDLISFQS